MNIERTTRVATCSRTEAAMYLGISPRTFDRIQEDKAIAYVQVLKRKRYLQSDLDAYLQSNRTIRRYGDIRIRVRQPRQCTRLISALTTLTAIFNAQQ